MDKDNNDISPPGSTTGSSQQDELVEISDHDRASSPSPPSSTTTESLANHTLLSSSCSSFASSSLFMVSNATLSGSAALASMPRLLVPESSSVSVSSTTSSPPDPPGTTISCAIPETVSAPNPSLSLSSSPALCSSLSSYSSDVTLHRTWTLWYDHPRLAPEGADWKETLKKIGTFSTVGTFWRMFNNIKPPSHLTSHANYSLFRVGVLPTWEDPENEDGGKFVLTIPKKESRAGKLDEYWLHTVLAVIGETMDATGDQVNGVVISIRKSQDRLALWLKTGNHIADRETCIRIGERWKKVMNLEKTAIRYHFHKDAAATGRSFRNETQFHV